MGTKGSRWARSDSADDFVKLIVLRPAAYSPKSIHAIKMFSGWIAKVVRLPHGVDRILSISHKYVLTRQIQYQ